LSIVSAASGRAVVPKDNPRSLRVVFCTRGGFFGERVLARLLSCDRIELCGMVRSSRVYNARYGFFRGAAAYLRRTGLAYSLYLFCATDVADAVGAVRRPTNRRLPHIPVHTTRNLNDARGLQFLRDCAPDVLVSAFFDQRLHEAALAIPTLGCVNIHPSLLPAFRGVDPVLQARLQGTSHFGVTVHYMTPEFDAGNVLAQQPVAARSNASIFEATAQIYDQGAALLTGEALGPIQLGHPGTPQPQGGSYESWPTRAEIQRLRTGGWKLMRFSDYWRIAQSDLRRPL
jgi:methionyl-tRNA formyltransferase